MQVEAVGICAGDAKTFAGAERFWGKFVNLNLRNVLFLDFSNICFKSNIFHIFRYLKIFVLNQIILLQNVFK